MNVLLHRVWLPLFTLLLTAGCSVFVDNGVESAPYTLVKADVSQNIEVRNYDSMILVSTDIKASGSGLAFCHPTPFLYSPHNNYHFYLKLSI